MAIPGKVSFALVAACSLVVAAARVAEAQQPHITIDSSFGPPPSLGSGPSYTIPANFGRQVQGNLLHSFGQFNLSLGERATFTSSGSTGTINNVIGRVTGGAPSNINGAIVSSINGANLYLINPSGIVFMPNATVNVSGSFHASTADYLKLSDGTKIPAGAPVNSTFTSAPPAAFGFLTASPSPIMVNSGSTLGPVPTSGSVPATLGLVGGPISITGGTLRAPGGTIHVTGIAGTGEVPVNPADTSALTVTSFAPVDIKSSGPTRSLLTASNAAGFPTSGGSVFIRSSALTVDSSTIAANNNFPGPGGQIVLRGDNQVTLSNTAMLSNVAQVQAFANSSGSGAGVNISTAPAGVVLIDGYTVSSLTTSAGPNAGPGGAISIIAGRLALHNGANVLGGSCVATAAADCGIGSGPAAGAGGGVGVWLGGSLTIDSLASLGTIARGSGNAGDVLVFAGPTTIERSVSTAPSVLAGIGSLTSGTGNAGNVKVTAGDLTLTKDGLVSSLTAPGATKNSGTVSVNVSGMLSIDGSGGIQGFRTGILGDTFSSGHGGDVTVTAGRIAINGGACAIGGGNCSGVISSETGFGFPSASGEGGSVTVNAGSISIAGSGVISSDTFGAGRSGSVSVSTAGGLTIDGTTTPGSLTGIFSQARTGSTKDAGGVSVNAGSISIINSGMIAGGTFGPGNGGSVSVKVAANLTIDGAMAPGVFTGISSQTNKDSTSKISTGNAGLISVSAGGISIANSGRISSGTVGPGDAGQITVTAGTLSIVSNGAIASATTGSGKGGSVSVSVAGQLSLDGATGDPTSLTGISSQTQGGGAAGTVAVTAGTLSIAHSSVISSDTFAQGKGGSVAVTVDGPLTIDGSGTNPDVVATGIVANSEAGSSGNAGDVTVAAGSLSLVNGGAISSALRPFMNLPASTGTGGGVAVNVGGTLSMSGSESRIGTETSVGSIGDAGSVTVNAAQISLANGGEIISTTAGSGAGGSVRVTTPGALVLDGQGIAGTQIAASAIGTNSGPGGSVTVAANTLTIEGGAQIASTTAGPGKGGDVGVTVTDGVTLSGSGLNGASGISAAALPGSSGAAGEVVLTAGGAIALSGGAEVSSSTAGAGRGGSVQVTAGEPLSLMGAGSGIIALAKSTANGDAGAVTVTAPQITLTSGAEIASTTAGTGAGGFVSVTTSGALVLDGAGVANTQIAASAMGSQSGPGGSVTVGAGSLTVEGGAQIAGTTAGPGKGGDLAVTVANGVALSGSGPNGASGISAAALAGSSGAAGEVVLTAGGAIALSGGAEITSSTAGMGRGGSVQVTAGGLLSLTNPGSGIIALAKSSANGDAGAVTVTAPQITLTSGAEIASTTAGTGAGGFVSVTTPGALVLDGAGVANTRIAASATGRQSGPGGSVTVSANSLTVERGAQIASSTAGPGKGGDVDIMVASDIVLPDRGPQITALSTGSGDAGSITVSATRLLLNDGAAISTEAETSTASGGNITLHVRDFLYLVSSEISTSVKGETGNGGNITIDPDLVILNHSSIIAEAIEGHGGNITITAGQFIPSSDSIVSATSQLGISGTIVINGPRVDVNGALVVLSTQLRGRAAVLSEACAARSDRPISSLVEAGRGGLPQDPEATLPALYLAGRDLGPSSLASADATRGSEAPLRTTVHLTMRCSG